MHHLSIFAFAAFTIRSMPPCYYSNDRMDVCAPGSSFVIIITLSVDDYIERNV